MLSNQINTLCQDSRGYLWIGTNVGVSVYDGTAFSSITSADGLSHNYVLAIAESRRSPGTMWIGTLGGGVSRMKAGTFTTILPGTTLDENSVAALVEDSRGELWCGTYVGAFRIRDGRVMSVDAIPERGHTSIIESPDSNLYVGVNQSLYVRPARSEQFHRVLLNVPPWARIRCLAVDNEGNVWVGSTDSLIIQVRGTSVIATKKLAVGEPPWYILDDHEGGLWVCVKQCVLRIERKEFPTGKPTCYTAGHGFQSNDVGPFLRDREGNLWFGSYSNGLSKLADQHIVTFGPISGVPAENQARVALDNTGRIWSASGDGLWEMWSEGTGVWHSHIHHMTRQGSAITPQAVLCDPKGNLWVMYGDSRIVQYATSHARTSPSTLRVLQEIAPGKHFPAETPQCFILDRHGLLWYSLQRVGVVIMDLSPEPRTLIVLREENGLPDLAICALYEDRDGNIWFGGHHGGLAILPKGDWVGARLAKYTDKDGLPDNRVRSFLQDAQGRMWITTEYGGLAVFENGRFRSLRPQPGTTSTAFRFITDHGGNRLWWGRGVPDEGLTEGPFPRFAFTKELTGLPVVPVGVSRNGTMCTITWRHVTVFEPSPVPKATLPPPIYITEVQVNGARAAPDTPLTLSYNQNNCVIQFVGLSFKDEKAVRYQYKLDGIDDDWSPPSPQRMVNYAALKPGSYRFTVRAINSSGDVSSSPAALVFTITPPFWQRWWFLALVVGAVVLATYLIVQVRARRLLEIERLRVRIASDLHDDVGSSLTRLAVQAQLLHEGVDTSNIQTKLGNISRMSSEVIGTMGDIVWSIDARNDTIGSLVDRMRDCCNALLAEQGIDFQFETYGLDVHKRIPVDVRQNIYLVLKEAVNNIAKYAQASMVTITLHNENNRFSMRISDNGQGLSAAKRLTGQGMHNMKMRADRIGGMVEFIED
ncbi:MAG: two-component regulator propeller domain-containing protein, partial [Bacteroidota bacterium]